MTDKSPAEQAFDEFDRREDFTLNTVRRKYAKRGFMAGWHARKVAELRHAFGLPAAKVFGRAWMRQLCAELREGEAIMATIDGRNWFRDSTGKIWVDVPHDALTTSEVDSNLDAGIPVG